MTTQATEPRVSGKGMPHDVQAEASILGAILFDNRAADIAATLLSPLDFFDNRHRMIFEAMLKMSEANQPIDLVTLSDTLRTSGQLEQVGGGVYISDLQDRVYSAANANQHAQIVQEKSSLRQLITTANEVNARAQSEDDPKELIEFADRSFFQIASRGKSNDIRSQADVA
ncbi:MAG: DnaB-like helicase N-terminal domain-containing protein, partial [Candidatus Zixiibacteriota bacterium]